MAAETKIPARADKALRKWSRKEFYERTLNRANHECQGSPKYPDCRAKNGEPNPRTGATVDLTVVHLDFNWANNSPSNLVACCQGCIQSREWRYWQKQELAKKLQAAKSWKERKRIEKKLNRTRYAEQDKPKPTQTPLN